MKLGKGSTKYKFKFVYETTSKVTYKYVYADNIKEAKELFSEFYKDVQDIRLLSIRTLTEC